MQKWFCIVLLGLGCNGIFEENPAFTPDSDGSTSAVDTGGTTSGTTASAGTGGMTSTTMPADSSSSSSSSGDEAPTECEGVDMYEPNDSETELTLLDSVASDEVVEISAQLDSVADEDWFKQPLEQAGATVPQPTATVAAPEPVRVCIYLYCSVGELVIDCGSYAPDTSGTSQPGCCGDDEISVGYQCTGAVDLDASTYLRVTTTGPTEACIPYELTYDFTG